MYKYKGWITLLIIKKNRHFILKRAKDYYYNNIDTIRKNMRDKREKMREYQKNYREKRRLNKNL